VGKLYGGSSSFDLFAQRYTLAVVEPLPTPSAPFVSALSQNSLYVAWAESLGQAVSHYNVYIDGASTPIEVNGGMYNASDDSWAAASTHSVKIAYVLQDGRISPASPTATARTWGPDSNGDGLPDEWQRAYWGADPTNWPATNADPDEDGATVYQEFVAGTNPIDANSVLRTELAIRDTGVYLTWNSAPGGIYQPQATSDFKSWENLGNLRFAASTTDSIELGAPNALKYYRVIRMR